jgi:hypothetical protein
MRYTLRLRMVNDLGDAFTDIPTDETTARMLIDAGCWSWTTPGPYELEPSRTYVEIFDASYVNAIGRQRDEYRKSVDLAASLSMSVLELRAKLDSTKAVLAATRGDLIKAQRRPR